MDKFINISMDGEWEFFYSPQKFTPILSILPEAESYTGRMVTPGYWDDHYDLFDEEDFFGLTARFNPDYRKPHFPMGRTLTPHASSSFLIGTGYYRKQIFIPEGFKSVQLSVGPAMWGCCVYCNGNFAGQVTGYSTGSCYILEDFLRAGQENEIIIVVCNLHDDGGAYHRLDKSHDGIPFGARPGQHRGLAAQGYQSERGGINCGVSLKLSPGAVLTDYFISFARQVPCWHVETRGEKAELQWRMSWQGNVIDSGTVDVDGTVEFTSALPPELWSDRKPALCDIELILKCNGLVTDQAEFRWGAALLTADKMALKLNGIPTILRGVTEHCYFADTTNPHCDKEKYLRELGVLRKAGFNFIRCHTWCPPEPFFQACDELGFIVQTELTSVWNFDEAEALIRQIRRHPCAMILCEGNEKIIDEVAMLRLQKLVDMLHAMAPGLLFNPQEAMRGIEYEFAPGRAICQHPIQYDIERLERVRKISDCFGALGEFSYGHDLYPGREIMEERMAVYGRPCLVHEAGILGGYLDFSLEERYENTFIGTDMFKAAREHMKKCGVYQNARKYYEKNCLFISSCRKQLMENLRSCRNIAGFDYLGGIDTHWHLIGYPCGVFNEFYEEKFGESVADVQRYCGESILLCTAGNKRNFQQGNLFSHDIEFSCYEGEGVTCGKLQWRFESVITGDLIASGEELGISIPCGTVTPVGKVEFSLPETGKGEACILKAAFSANGKVWDNFWNFWTFPVAGKRSYDNVKVCNRLTDEDVRFMEQGGRIMLTDNFPGKSFPENFRAHTTGRSLGHAGALFNEHPIWKNFPHAGFLDWQFFPLMKESRSLIYDPDMPRFNPVFELIPSFKLVKHKGMLSEFTVGRGRLMVCGFRLDVPDPAAAYMEQVIMDYLGTDGSASASAPEWSPDALRQRLQKDHGLAEGKEKKVDAGGRPIA